MLTTLFVLSPLTGRKVSKNRGSAACCERKAQLSGRADQREKQRKIFGSATSLESRH
jgi:hypothetical protein